MQRLPPLLCATLLCFSNHAGAFELSGTVRYRIDVPEGTLLALVARAPQWEAEPKIIYDTTMTGAPDILRYRAAVPEAALAQELLAMEKEDVAARTDWPAIGSDLQARQRMRAAAAQGEITPSRLALAIDRDLSNDKLPQLYGSQFQTGSDGKSVAFPIADPQHLEQRRASMGMEPYAQYKQAFE